MANTVFKLRRSSVAGKSPNTSTLSTGELAINLTDRKLYSSDGTNIFETGSNLTSLSVFSDISVGNSTVNTVINSSSISVKSIVANGGVGTTNQVLASNGTGIYWTSPSSGSVAGSNTQIQFNDSGSANATAGFTFDKTSNTVSVGNSSVNTTLNTTGLNINAVTIANTTGVYTGVVNATSHTTGGGYGSATGGAIVNTTTIAVGNSTVNVISNSSVLSVGSLSINSSGTTTNTFQIGTGLYSIASGNVGIGTTSPSYKLDVNGYVSASRYYLTNTNSVYCYGDTSGWVFTGSGYVYFAQGGASYFATRIQARAGISDDTNTTLTLYGGTGGYTTINGSARSPIFYDSNDTNYYLDPASASYLNDLRPNIIYDKNNTSYYVDGNSESRLYRLRVGPYAGSATSGNITGLELVNNGSTGDSNLAAMSFHCSSSYGMHLHLRADGYFGAGGWSASSWRWYVYMPNGDMTAAGNVTAYSDPRLKTDITSIESPLEKISQLNGVKFKWIDSSVIGHPGEYDYGILSSDVEKVMPELVIDSIHESPDGDKYKTVAYDKLAPLLIECIKEQQKQINELKSKIDDLARL